MGTRLLLPLLALAAAACGGEPGAPDAGPAEGPDAAPAETRPLTEGLALWRADGFTLLVPEEADIVPRTAEPPETWAAILAGPGFVRDVEGVTVPGPPAYRLDAATYAKPDTVDLSDWVAARITERGEGGAAGVTVPLAGEPALRTGAPPAEAGPASYWLEREGKVVELRVEEEPESPLGPLQRHVQALILSTFRWSGEPGEPAEPRQR